ncbi:hypothetical protein BKA56DRAFT_676892 [Ilyonectria sp. MPI-CAGE-AT-0026]|nr:hypothetical protein BKA56DRAFT_676892 [Ilyonectria sp. MPI-CAGE-AT-0026]
MKGKCIHCYTIKQLHSCPKCPSKLCQGCIESHYDASGHGLGINTRDQSAVNWMLGKDVKWAEKGKERLFREDETTKWFGIWREVTDPTRSFLWLVETPRFEHLLLQSRNKSARVRVFPRLVTFVGESGVGKSTIIRGLMSARGGVEADDQEGSLPAFSDVDPSKSTTGEVNLYADPETFETESPILFVDCEGIRGTEPLAAQFQTRWYSKHATSTGRAKAAEEIYPRFLYIFSDVICLVVKQTKSICNAVINLLKWSQVCTGHVVNQYSLPSAIIVINAWDPSEWTPASGVQSSSLEQAIFETVEQEAVSNPFLKDLMEKGGSSTLRELISHYFSAFRVCCIPRTHYNKIALTKPREVMRSLEELAIHISEDSRLVGEKRQRDWARLDSGQMQLLFRHAFEHLASGKPGPFDFGRSRQMMELPKSTTDYLSKFLLFTLGEFAKDNLNFAAKAIAGSLVIEAMSPELVAIPNAILNDKLKEKLNTAATIFLNHHLRCAFIRVNDEHCVNTKSGHARGHQSSSGEDLGTGEFDPGDFSENTLVTKIDQQVREVISAANTKLEHKRWDWITTTHAGTLRSAPRPTFISRAIIALPQTAEVLSNDRHHAPRLPHTAVHTSCFLCGSNDSNEGWPVRVPLQPPLAGVRVLSLDGGGARGIMELATLKKLEDMIGIGLPIAEFFDLTIGTNGGGFIAIGLVAHGWGIDNVISKFKELGNRGLESQTQPWWYRFWKTGPESLYQTETFERELRSIFTPERKLFGLRPCLTPGKLSNVVGRVAVTVCRNDKPFLLANYDYGDDDNYVDSRRLTWAASRATWATPYHFVPFTGATDTGPLVDGGLFYNDPTDKALSEKKRLWHESTPLDLLVSIGSGKAADKRPPMNKFHVMPWVRDWEESYFAARTERQSRYDSETESNHRKSGSHVRRINVDCGQREFKIDDFARLTDMEERARSELQTNKGTLSEIATRLKASLFYWDLEEIFHSANGRIVSIKGIIRCRISRQTTPVTESCPFRQLLDAVRRFRLMTGYENRGVFDDLKPPKANENGLLMLDFKFNLDAETENGEVAIEVEFHDEGENPSVAAISGSPFTLAQLRRYAERHLQRVPAKKDVGVVNDYKKWSEEES